MCKMLATIKQNLESTHVFSLNICNIRLLRKNFKLRSHSCWFVAMFTKRVVSFNVCDKKWKEKEWKIKREKGRWERKTVCVCETQRAKSVRDISVILNRLFNHPSCGKKMLSKFKVKQHTYSNDNSHASKPLIQTRSELNGKTL